MMMIVIIIIIIITSYVHKFKSKQIANSSMENSTDTQKNMFDFDQEKSF